MRKLFSLISLVLVFSSFAFGQLAQIDIPITVVNGPKTQELRVGLDQTATNGIDATLGESIAPPAPPVGAFNCVLNLGPVSLSTINTWKDYRPAAAYPFTGNMSHRILYQLENGFTSLDFNYNVPANVTLTLAVQGGPTSGPIVGPATGTFTYDDPDGLYNRVNVTMAYSGITPPVNGPVFLATPSPLNFGNVNVGVPATLPLTVKNDGNQPLVITAIASDNLQFGFTSDPLPITLAPAATTTVQVTFTPTAATVETGNLTFTDNGLFPPHVVVMNGTGHVPAPVIGFAPASLDFGPVGVGLGGATLPVTVSNTGDAALDVTGIVSSDPQYTFAPATFTVPAGGNQVVNVTFTPTAAGTFPATLTLTHNAAGSPSIYNVTGVGNAFAGLTHQEESKLLLEGVISEDTLQLMALNGDLQAMQFTFEVNMGTTDSKILTLLNIIKGNDVAADPNWVLEYKVFKGTGANYLKDYVKVLLYNVVNGQVLHGTNTNFLDLLRIRVRTNNLPTGVDFQTSTILLKQVLGSDPFGNPVNVAPISKELLTVTVKNGVQSSWGDVNGDGYIDILDLINVVDHIVGRDSLSTTPGPAPYTTSEFQRANIAPWASGQPEPTPDAVVNVQDLSVIQWIILNGVLPNGDPIYKVAAGNLNKVGDASAKVTLYVTTKGIRAQLNSEIGIRGAQLEFNNISGSTSGMTISTPLKGAFYNQQAAKLRVLMYDGMGEAFIPMGDNLLANMPFGLTTPKTLSLDKVILVSTETQKVSNVSVEFVYSSDVIPSDYSLSQNYPNPFNPTTSVEFSVPRKDNVTIKIYNMLGQEVRTLFTGEVEGGVYKVQWDGKNDAGAMVNSGAYVYRMTAADFQQSRKMTFLK